MNDRILVLDETTYEALTDVLDYILDPQGDSEGMSPLEIKASIVARALADQNEEENGLTSSEE